MSYRSHLRMYMIIVLIITTDSIKMKIKMETFFLAQNIRKITGQVLDKIILIQIFPKILIKMILIMMITIKTSH